MFGYRKKFKKAEKSPILKDSFDFDRDKDGRVQIKIGVKDVEELFSPYSFKSYEILDSGLTEHIEIFESQIPISDDISLDFYTEDRTTNEEKKRIRRAIDRHYSERLVTLKRKQRINTWAGLIMSVLGLLILLLEAALYMRLGDFFLDAVLAVIGWLFLWDGIEVFVWDRNQIRRETISCYRLINAKVHIRQYSKKIQRAYKIGEFEEDEEEPSKSRTE